MMANIQTLKEIVLPLLDWYARSARILPWRENQEPYRIWVSEIMLQQTRVEAVKPYFDRFINTLPDVPSLAEAREETLLKLWEGLGYYNRVRNMQKAAELIMRDYQGQFPTSYASLIGLPGIGEYTAGAIASIAFGETVTAVDGNVLRVLARVLAYERNVTQAAVKKEMKEALAAVLPDGRTGDFNQALMELGATVCLPNGAPLCEQCPIAFVCKAFQQNDVMNYPLKAPKKPRRPEERTVFIIQLSEKTALRKRPQKGLLAGMWEYPNFEGTLSEDCAEELLEALGIPVKRIDKLGYAKHIFTHIEWHMKGYLIETEKEVLPPGWLWATQTELKTQFALPSAFKEFHKMQKAKRL